MVPKIARINPDQLHKPPGYHHITVVEPGRTAFLAGQCPLDVFGTLVGPGDINAQIDMIASNAAAALAPVGAKPSLEGLDGDQLAQSSLCSGWDVRTVAAHLATAVSPSKKSFVVAMLRHRGDMHRANDEIARRAATQPVAQLVATLRRYADSRFAPPLVGPRGPLTDVLVHAGDMRIPLGLPYQPDNAHVRMALEFVTAGRPIGFVPRGRLDGLRLIPDDLDWSFGNGAVVHGRGINILMSACGRGATLTQLSGTGVGLLRQRILR